MWGSSSQWVFDIHNSEIYLRLIRPQNIWQPKLLQDSSTRQSPSFSSFRRFKTKLKNSLHLKLTKLKCKFKAFPRLSRTSFRIWILILCKLFFQVRLRSFKRCCRNASKSILTLKTIWDSRHSWRQHCRVEQSPPSFCFSLVNITKSFAYCRCLAVNSKYFFIKRFIPFHLHLRHLSIIKWQGHQLH